MVKKMKRRRYSRQTESPTKEFRQVAQVGMGAGMVGMMTPLMTAPTPGNIGNAIQGSVGFAILAPMSGVGFNAIDNIYNTGKKKKLM
jgi:hypothetical protein